MSSFAKTSSLKDSIGEAPMESPNSAWLWKPYKGFLRSKTFLLKFGTGGQVVPLGFDLWPREKCPKDFNFSPKVTL